MAFLTRSQEAWNSTASMRTKPINSIQRMRMALLDSSDGVVPRPWRGCRENRDGWWLRWWDEQEQLLLWGIEQVERERQRADAQQQRADAEQQRAERLLGPVTSRRLRPRGLGRLLLLDEGGGFPDKGFGFFVGHDVSPRNQGSLSIGELAEIVLETLLGGVVFAAFADARCGFPNST